MNKSSDYIDDKILWDDLKAGNKSSFNELFRRYYSSLYYYGIKIFSDTNFVEECIQEVFIRVWETRSSLSDVRNLKSYLLVSLRRMILVKKSKNKHNIEIGDAEGYSFLFEENEFEKHEEIPDEVRRILLKAVNSLTVKQRELIMLYFYHELPYSEVADVMNISVQSARNLMYRTLTRLREVIGTSSITFMQNILFSLFSTVS